MKFALILQNTMPLIDFGRYLTKVKERCRKKRDQISFYMENNSQTPSGQTPNEIEFKKETIRRLLDSKNELDEKTVIELLDSDPALRKAVFVEMLISHPDFVNEYAKKHNIEISDDDEIDIDKVVQRGEAMIRRGKKEGGN